ncbi:MAG: YIP1 family protein [Acidobacteriaceae bacterium]
MAHNVANVQAPKPLNQVERVVDVFVAAPKTFFDILRDTSWWLPWLLGVLVTLGFGLAIQQKIGWAKTYNNILLQSSQAQLDRMSQLPPEQQARQKVIGSEFVEYIFWGTPVLSLVFAAIASGVLFVTLNYGLGGKATFPQMFAVWMYATLPFLIQGILAIITVFAGLDPDSFNLKNPVGTNIGYFLPMDSPKWLIALGTAIDVLTIWVLILLTLGCAIVGKVKKSTAAFAVWGWWILITLVKVAASAL